MMARKAYISGMLILLFLFAGLMLVSAQGDIPSQPGEPRQVCPVTFDRIEPRTVTSGTASVLSVFGIGFEAGSTTISVVGLGALETTVFNETTANAPIPANIAPGSYTVRLVDERCGPTPITGDPARPARTTLVVNPAPATPQPPPPTLEIPTLAPPPTPLPGEPFLLARNFTTFPNVAQPGQTITLNFEVVNQGNRAAEGVVATVDASGSFVPAVGQASTILPNIPPGGTATVSLSVIATAEAPAGPSSVPITIAYRDFTGESYTSTASLSVIIERVTEVSQITLARYQYDPNPAVPGEPLTLTVLITNTGNQTANQALLRVGGEGGVLLAGPQGDRFPLGDIAPGASISLDLPVVVSRSADPGPQSQPFSVTFFQNSEAQEVSGTLTINVARVVEPEPVILLDSYDVDRDPLQPGEEFTLTVNLDNVGQVPAQGMLATFGTVESRPSGGGGDDDEPGSGSGTGGTSTNPSNTFAPLGTGGTLFIGDLGAEMSTSFEQSFIVNGTVESGIYSLPITLRYQTPGGRQIQDNLRVSVVVIAPPTLRLTLQNPVPPEVNIGEPLVLPLEIANTGSRSITVTEGQAEAENAEVVDGASRPLETIATNDDITYEAVIIPQSEGPVTITLKILYRDALNTVREITETYETVAVMPPPPPDFGPPPDIVPTPEPEPDPSEILGRFLRGLLGLGS